MIFRKNTAERTPTFASLPNVAAITTQANSYAKSLETLRNNFNKQKQNLEAAK